MTIETKGWLTNLLGQRPGTVVAASTAKTKTTYIPSLGDVGPKILKQYLGYKKKWPNEYNLHDWCFLLYDLFCVMHKRMMPHSLVKDAGMMKRILQTAGDPFVLYQLIAWAVMNVDDLTINMLNSSFMTGWLKEMDTTVKTAKACYIGMLVDAPEQRRIILHLCVLAESDNDEAQEILDALVAKWEAQLRPNAK